MTIRLISRSVVATLALVTSMPFLAQAVEIDVGKTRVILGGYAKLDLIYNDASNGRLTGEESAFGTDFYLPFAVPVEGDGASHQTVYADAKESRIILETKTDIQRNKLSTYLEMDF